ncbi:hypothetical protein EVAR_39700_1 [Eumeta japonica]|uniref:Uncharacterized protein n=1 Tax=Eumeta variegata TaxID=151549 RepID=A0A4C1W5N3_EUMVA|nr:hypothetical protein EVAR_39700_1 [Eumeta japonica]
MKPPFPVFPAQRTPYAVLIAGGRAPRSHARDSLARLLDYHGGVRAAHATRRILKGITRWSSRISRAAAGAKRRGAV